jgi:hypothetical protein
MPLITLPYTFVPDTTADATQVNSNFATIVNLLNGLLDTENIATILEGDSVLTQNGQAVLPGGLILRWGLLTGVYVDGSTPVQVIYSTAYTLFAAGPFFAPFNTNFAANPWGLSPQLQAASEDGFTVYLIGGPAGQTASLFWFTIGV